MPYIFALTGGIGSGKSEFTRMLHEAEPDSASFESREIITEVANVFNAKLAASNWTDFSIDIVNGALEETAMWMNEHFKTTIDHRDIRYSEEEVYAKPQQFERLYDYLKLIKANPGFINTEVTAANKAQYRPLLQWLGGYFPYKYRAGIWFDEIGRRIRSLKPQPKLVSINALRYPHDEAAVREFAKDHNYTCLVIEIERSGTQDSNDVTERTRDQILSDIKVINNGSLAELKQTAQKIIADLPNTQKEYKAV